jgi:hypothetical protein
MRSRTSGSSCVVITPFPCSEANPAAQMLSVIACLCFGTLQASSALYRERAKDRSTSEARTPARYVPEALGCAVQTPRVLDS